MTAYEKDLLAIMKKELKNGTVIVFTHEERRYFSNRHLIAEITDCEKINEYLKRHKIEGEAFIDSDFEDESITEATRSILLKYLQEPDEVRSVSFMNVLIEPSTPYRLSKDIVSRTAVYRVNEADAQFIRIVELAEVYHDLVRDAVQKEYITERLIFRFRFTDSRQILVLGMRTHNQSKTIIDELWKYAQKGVFIR